MKKIFLVFVVLLCSMLTVSCGSDGKSSGYSKEELFQEANSNGLVDNACKVQDLGDDDYGFINGVSLKGKNYVNTDDEIQVGDVFYTYRSNKDEIFLYRLDGVKTISSLSGKNRDVYKEMLKWCEENIGPRYTESD